MMSKLVFFFFYSRTSQSLSMLMTLWLFPESSSDDSTRSSLQGWESKGLVSSICLQHKILGYVPQLCLFCIVLFRVFWGDQGMLIDVMRMCRALSYLLALLLICSISTLLWPQKHFESVSEAHILGRKQLKQTVSHSDL